MSLQNKIQKIIDVINNSNIEEIEVSSFWGAQKIRLSKNKSHTQQSPVIIKESKSDKNIQATQSDTNNIPQEEKSLNNDLKNEEEALVDPVIATENIEDIKAASAEDLEYQKAPLVGTFYLSSKPGEPSFVSVGDIVSKGQTLCIIEAMKIFNEIESDFDGEIVEVLVDDESPVEFNQEIFSIRPS